MDRPMDKIHETCQELPCQRAVKIGSCALIAALRCRAGR